MSVGPVDRAGIYPIDDVLPFVVMGPPRHGQENLDRRPQKEYDGKTVHMDSMRYQTFVLSGTTCVSCGLEAQYFALERQLRNKGADNRYHFNLYGLNNNREVLFTKDHIIPRARNGAHALHNLQTMCSPCNNAKGKDCKVTKVYKQSRSRIKKARRKIEKRLRENKIASKEAYQPNIGDGGPVFMALKKQRALLKARDNRLLAMDKKLQSDRKRSLKGIAEEVK